jgi:outer membrane protein assembly factor BamB
MTASKPLEDGDPRRIGPFDVLGRLGAGGMGVVFLARSPGGRLAAVKVVRPELADDEEFRARFRHEIQAARQVSGAFTAPVLDADPDARRPWLATAYVDGPSLRARVTGGGPLPVEDVRALGAGLAEALADLHRVGLVHRDVKPGNILLAADGPRLIDFGIIRSDGLAELTELTESGVVLGSAGYMAPEQADGQEAGPAADVFALGAVLTFAALGRGPFGSGNAATLLVRTVSGEPDLDGLPEGLRGLVAACLAREPGQRPSIARVLDTLAARGQAPVAAARAPIGPSAAAPADAAPAVRRPAATPEPAPRLTPLPAPEPAGLSRRAALILSILGLGGAGGVIAAGISASHSDPSAQPARGIQPPTTDDFTLPMPSDVPGRATSAVWTATVPDSSVLVPDGKLLYIGGQGITAVKTSDGSAAWHSASAGEFTGDRPLAPVPSHELVCAAAGNTVYALDTADGTHLWSTPNPDIGSGGTTDIVGVFGTIVVCHTSNGDSRLWAVDAATGNLAWSHPLSATAVAVAAGPYAAVAVLGTTTVVTAYHPAKGDVAWQQSLTALSTNGTRNTCLMAASSRTLYVGGDQLFSMDLTTGKPGWSFIPPTDSGSVQALIADADHAFAALGFQDITLDYNEGTSTVQALNQTDGTSAWSTQVPHVNDFRPPLTVAGGVVYSVDESAVTLTALAAQDGSALWHWEAASREMTGPPPVVASDAENAYLLQVTKLQAFAAH